MYSLATVTHGLGLIHDPKIRMKDTKNLKEALTRFHTVWNERSSEMHVREDDIAGGHFLRSFRHPKPQTPKP